MSSDFVHLHLHSEYSILDGACRIDRLMKQTTALNMKSLALTDHGNLFGAIDFYRQAKQAGIKPIIGCEMYLAPRTMYDKQLPDLNINYYHLVLLAKDAIGYQNLMKLVTAGYFEGFYYKPRIDKQTLAKHAAGLIGMSACLHGEIPSLLQQDRFDDAVKVAGQFSEIFGPENFYLELMDHGIPEEKKVNLGLVKLSAATNLPLVVTNDCHYLRPEDASSHDVLLCIQTGKKFKDADRMRFTTDQLYFKSGEEMARLFGEQPDALRNTAAIAERCNLDLQFDTPMLPNFTPPEGQSVDGYFELQARSGMEERFLQLGIGSEDSRREEYQNRMAYEIEIIKQMGFQGYFLVVWDFIRFAREYRIPVGPGRGSAAGSLVAYAMRITDLDPIRYHLVFERFLNPSRISMPDIDIDFCQRSRGRVIEYVSNKYGQDNVSQIITFGTMAARNVIRDVGRVLDIPLTDVDRIAKLVPDDLKMTIERALQLEPLIDKERKENSEIARLLDVSQVLEGLKRHPSTHAAGVVISREPLINHTPLYKGTKGEVTTQYAMGFLENLGLLKMDFLGLRTLTVMSDTLQMVRENYGVDVVLSEIPEDDPATFDLLTRGKTAGVFQLESSGMTDIVRKLRPNSISDLIALVAIYRPGPMGSGMIEDFLKRKHGLIPIAYLLPQLEPILKETYGVILYQEQVMRIASVLAGYSMARADELRKAMGKKKIEIMDKHKSEFLKGASERAIPADKAETIFDQMAKFAGYGFNKSHAAAYAVVAYQTAYLKAHFPHEYMACLLTSEQDHTEKIVKYIHECRNDGITVQPPDVNVSGPNFTVSGQAIRFGLAAVKNVGINAVESIIESRQKGGPFSSIFDFCNRVDLRSVNKRVIESLIKAGAFDSSNAFRSQLFEVLDRALEQAQSYQKEQQVGQYSIFEILNLEESFQNPASSLPRLPEWPQNLILAYEKECLGFYVTGHPLEYYRTEIDRFCTHSTSSIENLKDGEKFFFGGILSSLKTHITKNQEKMAFTCLEDMEGSIDLTVLPDVYKESSEIIKLDMPVLVKGEMNIMDGSRKVKALEIIPLSRIREKYAQRLLLQLHSSPAALDNLQKVKTLFENNPGQCRVTLQIFAGLEMSPIERVDIELPDSMKINPSGCLIEELQKLIGDTALSFELASKD